MVGFSLPKCSACGGSQSKLWPPLSACAFTSQTYAQRWDNRLFFSVGSLFSLKHSCFLLPNILSILSYSILSNRANDCNANFTRSPQFKHCVFFESLAIYYFVDSTSIEMHSEHNLLETACSVAQVLVVFCVFCGRTK